MVLRPIKFNNQDGGGGAPVAKGFEALSESGIIEEAVNRENNSGDNNSGGQDGSSGEVATSSKENNSITNTGSPDDGASGGEQAPANSTTTEPKFDDKGNQVDDKGGIVKTKEQLDAEETITEFKIPGSEASTEADSPEEKARKEALAELAKESSWTALGKARGLDVTENTFEAYDKALTEKFTAEATTIKEAAKAEARDELLAEKPIEAMAIIMGLEEGFTIDELIEPKRNIEKLEALSDADLVAEDYRLKGWDQEKIDKKIADLTEKEMLDVEAQPLRDILKENKETLAQKQIAQLTALKQSKEATVLKARQQESEEIKNTLLSMKTYMDVPITEKVVNHIKQKWDKNEYHEAFKDPKVVAEFLMYKEFGEQGLKALKNREYQRGRDEKAKVLHNVPPVQNVGSKANSTVGAKTGFAALPE